MQESQAAAELGIRLSLAAMPLPEQRTQAWLAAQIGESPFWLSRRMSGTQRFTVDDLDRIAAVFGTDLVGLITSMKGVA